MTTTIIARGDKLAISAFAGTWHFDPVRGYIRRFVERMTGRNLVNDLLRKGPDPHAPLHLNEPRAGGIGSFGCHIIRENWIGETNTRMISNQDEWGVHDEFCNADESKGNVYVVHHCVLYDPWAPVFDVARSYCFGPDFVRINAIITELGAPDVFIKEAKFQAGLCPPSGVAYEMGTHFNDNGVKLAHKEFTDLANPWRGTWQIRSPNRCRLHFQGAQGALGFHALGDAEGFNAWAADADKRPRFRDDCAAYCLQGPNKTLTRAWEIAKRKDEPDIGLMFHVWEGGAGASDCLCAARQSKRSVWRLRMAFSYGPGWKNAQV